jgi:hypothetical protein
MRNNYVNDEADLFNSIIEFHNKPEHWRTLLGSSPKYFLNYEDNGDHYFGISKFCAFKDISVEDYIKIYKNKTGGGTTQNVIRNRIEKEWIPRDKVSSKVRDAFDDWIKEFYPNYNLSKASFISISTQKNRKRTQRRITPETLKKKLDQQIINGIVGENIAYQYEFDRLIKNGSANPKKHITHTSKSFVNAGFDILTETSKETRYIEVKSTTTLDNTLFLSENEVETLRDLGEQSYLYLVKITDSKNGIGYVDKIINNPIEEFEKKNLMISIAYKVVIPK